MPEVSIRIPLSAIIAGNYKVGLSPRDAAKPRVKKTPVKKPQIDLSIFDNDLGGWILADGAMYPVTEQESEGNGHDDAAARLGLHSEWDALESGAIRVDLSNGLGTMFEVNRMDDNTRRLLRENIHNTYKNWQIIVEWWQPKHGTAEFRTKEEALEWLEGRTVFAAKKKAPVPVSSIHQMGGWISPDGKIFSLKSNNLNDLDYEEHEDTALDMGFASSQKAREAGAIRIAMLSGAVGIEVEKLTSVIRSRIREFLSDMMASYDGGVILEWQRPRPASKDFDSLEDAIDWLENRMAITSSLSKVAVSLPELVQQTNAFSTKNRPGCTAKLEKSDPKGLMLQYRVTCNLKESDPKGHEMRVQFDVSKIQEDQNANDLDVQCYCSCPAFLYWGAQWNLHQRDGLLGQPRPLLQAPTERLDLRSNFVICKHCKAVFERILPSVQHNINNIERERKVEEAKRLREEEGAPPPTMKRQPGKPAPEAEEMEEMSREEAKRLMLEQEGVVERGEPATNEEKRKHPTLEEKPKPRWRQTIDKLKERIKGWVGIPTPEEGEEKPEKSEDQRVQQELLREERRKMKMPLEQKHPEKPHIDEGLPYEPRWKQLVKKLKDRVKSWGSKGKA